jgi:hypothetical protein
MSPLQTGLLAFLFHRPRNPGFAETFRTETRAVATDAAARRNFRRYWSFLSPGIIVIRWMLLGPLKADAERRARQ